MKEIIFKENRGSLKVELAKENVKTWVVTIGKCTCYKNTCDCLQQMVIPKSIIKEVRFCK